MVSVDRMSDFKSELLTPRECEFISGLVKNIEKTYEVHIKYANLPAEIIREIIIIYYNTSGCGFADWLNHKLYTYCLTAYLKNNDNDGFRKYRDFEDLEEADDE